MDYEKKYKEVFERAKGHYGVAVHYGKEEEIQELEHIFPELKEIGEDKKMKEMAIKAVHSPEAQSCLKSWGVNPDDVIAWLEKQGEQKQWDFVKPVSEEDKLYLMQDEKNLTNSEKTCKVEPKFKVGDWIVDNSQRCANSLMQIVKVTKNEYLCHYEQGQETYTHRFIEERYHLWTIQDAKDGDVLLSPSTPAGDKECPFIFKETDEDGIVRYHAALLQSEKFKIADGITNVMGYANAGYHIPATKEQRDLLFKKMREAGYQWDSEKKELKKIEKKPAWSEEDEKAIKWVIDYIGNCPNKSFDFYGGVGKEAVVSLLNKFKNILLLQPKQEWSEEDEKMFEFWNLYYEHNVGDIPNKDVVENLEKFRDWLKALKERYTWKPGDEHYELKEFAKIVRGNLTGISKDVQELFEAKYLQLTGNKMYGGYKD